MSFTNNLKNLFNQGNFNFFDDGEKKKIFKKPADSDFLAVQDSFIGDLVTQSVRDF